MREKYASQKLIAIDQQRWFWAVVLWGMTKKVVRRKTYTLAYNWLVIEPEKDATFE